MNGDWPGGEAIDFLVFPGVHILTLLEVQTFFGLQIGHRVVRKTVLYIVCFLYSLLSFLSLLVVVLVFNLLSY